MGNINMTATLPSPLNNKTKERKARCFHHLINLSINTYIGQIVTINHYSALVVFNYY